MKKEVIPQNFMLGKKSDGKLKSVPKVHQSGISKKDDTARKILRLGWDNKLIENE